MPEMFESVTELEDVKARPGKILVQIVRFSGLAIVTLLLLGVLYEKIRAPGRPPISTDTIILAAFVVLLLFVLLAFVEALQIAYTIVRGKHHDEFSTKEEARIKEMQENEDLVYGAREWVVTMIVAVITLATEYHELYIPIVKVRVPPALEPVWLVFTAVLTAVPIIWLAQWPGKVLAVTAPVPTLMSLPMRVSWQIVRAIGWIVEMTGLDIPEKFIEKWLERVASPQNLRPSDEGFFLSGLQRYGFAAHELSVKITIKEAGSCIVEQKLVW
jgi:hypothetical protein